MSANTPKFVGLFGLPGDDAPGSLPPEEEQRRKAALEQLKQEASDVSTAQTPASKELAGVLEKISRKLETLLTQTKVEQEIQEITGFGVTSNALPEDYAHKLTLGLLSLDSLLNQYCQCNFFSALDLAAIRRAGQDEELVREADEQIEIQQTDSMVLVHMPYLPGKRNPQFSGFPSVVTDLLGAKLLHYSGLPKWPACHANFFHVFPSGLSSMPKDVDNYDYKRTIDLLAMAIGFSDCASSFSMAMQCVFTDNLAPGTYIEITPKSSKNTKYPNWEKVAKQKKKSPDTENFDLECRNI